MNRKSKITFKDEIVLHDGREFRVSGTIEEFEGYIETMSFESIVDTESEITNLHLSTDHLFRKTVERKIDHLLPRYS